MEFFSNSKPNLINNQIDNKVKKFVLISQINNKTFSESLIQIYDNYIKHNLFPLIIFLVIGFFLYIRYNIKKMHIEEEYIQKKQKKKTKKQIILKPDQSLYDIDIQEEENNNEDTDKIIETNKIFNDILDEY